MINEWETISKKGAKKILHMTQMVQIIQVTGAGATFAFGVDNNYYSEDHKGVFFTIIPEFPLKIQVIPAFPRLFSITPDYSGSFCKIPNSSGIIWNIQ